MKTMTTMKTLMLAGLGALSIGIGSAMAQDGPSAVPDYQATHQQAMTAQNKAAVATTNSTVQFGGADIQRPFQDQGLDAGIGGGF